MNDEVNVVEVEARNLGWVPLDEFRGGEDKWVDAETFVRRGHEIMPILQKNNKALQADVTRLRSELSHFKKVVEDSQESMKALRELHDEDTKAKIAQTKKDIISQLKQAKENGDVDAELALTDQLSEVNSTIRDISQAQQLSKGPQTLPQPPQNTQPATEETPEFLEWKAENSWFDTDIRKRSLAIGIAQELRANPANQGLLGKEFLNRVSEELEATLGNKQTRTTKVEGSQGSSQTATGRNASGFSALPKEAKEACTSRSSKMVGEGKAFKTEADWKEYFAKLYFEKE